MSDLLKEKRILFGDDHTKLIELKIYLRDYRRKLSSVVALDGRAGPNELKEIFGDEEFQTLAKEQMSLIRDISGHVSIIKIGVENLLKAIAEAKSKDSSREMAESFCEEVIPFFATIRNSSDELEMMVDDELWPMTKYRELLFTK